MLVLISKLIHMCHCRTGICQKTTGICPNDQCDEGWMGGTCSQGKN
jgi:hypothetical protein